MKNDCGLVIIGFAAMQGYSISKAKVQENHGEIQNYGKHPTPQNNQRIYSLRKQHKTVRCVYRISVFRIGQI